MTDFSSKIQYMDGIRFKRVIAAAADRLIEKHGHLNAINVFPVPDGDTGSNMAGTMRNIVANSANSLDHSISKMSDIIAESALMGARGNSGVILAQFFCGFSEGVKNLTRVSPHDFAEAASLAATRAFESISHPTEGTILTVIRDWADHLKANGQSYTNFHDLVHDSLKEAKISLKSTKEKLASLKAADVVDAGAQGFVYLLEGIAEFIENGTLDRTAEREILPAENNDAQKNTAVEELTFSFCTECMVKGNSIDKKALKEQLKTLGDSIVVAGTDHMVRVHVHTNEPELAFAVAGEYGEISNRKVDDMLAQHRALVETPKQQVGILTDSACDLPEEMLLELGIHTVPMRLYMDETEYIDKETISTEEFNRRLASSTSVKTSQPTPGAFKFAYEHMKEEFEEVLAMHVVGRYSGTLQSSQTMARQVWDKISTFDCCNLTVAQGLIVREAALRAKRGMGTQEIIEAAQKDVRNLHLYVSMDTLDFVIRGGRMNKGMGLIAKALNIKPVLEFNSRKGGEVGPVAKTIGSKRCEKKTLELIGEAVKGKRNLRFAIAHVDAYKTATRYAEHIQRMYGVAPLYISSASPAVGVHSGPKACGIAVLFDDE